MNKTKYYKQHTILSADFSAKDVSKALKVMAYASDKLDCGSSKAQLEEAKKDLIQQIGGKVEFDRLTKISSKLSKHFTVDQAEKGHKKHPAGAHKH